MKPCNHHDRRLVEKTIKTGLDFLLVLLAVLAFLFVMALLCHATDPNNPTDQARIAALFAKPDAAFHPTNLVVEVKRSPIDFPRIVEPPDEEGTTNFPPPEYIPAVVSYAFDVPALVTTNAQGSVSRSGPLAYGWLASRSPRGPFRPYYVAFNDYLRSSFSVTNTFNCTEPQMYFVPFTTNVPVKVIAP